MKVLFTFTLVIAAALAQIPGDLYDGCYSGDKYCFGSPEGCVDAGVSKMTIQTTLVGLSILNEPF